jgi:hypothetical protein
VDVDAEYRRLVNGAAARNSFFLRRSAHSARHRDPPAGTARAKHWKTGGERIMSGTSSYGRIRG